MTMLSLYVSCAKRPSSTTFSSAGGGEEGYKCGIKSGVDVTPGDGSEPEAARGGQAEQILPLVNHKGIVPATKRVKEVQKRACTIQDCRSKWLQRFWPPWQSTQASRPSLNWKCIFMSKIKIERLRVVLPNLVVVFDRVIRACFTVKLGTRDLFFFFAHFALFCAKGLAHYRVCFESLPFFWSFSFSDDAAHNDHLGRFDTNIKCQLLCFQFERVCCLACSYNHSNWVHCWITGGAWFFP